MSFLFHGLKDCPPPYTKLVFILFYLLLLFFCYMCFFFISFYYFLFCTRYGNDITTSPVREYARRCNQIRCNLMHSALIIISMNGQTQEKNGDKNKPTTSNFVSSIPVNFIVTHLSERVYHFNSDCPLNQILMQSLVFFAKFD